LGNRADINDARKPVIFVRGVSHGDAFVFCEIVFVEEFGDPIVVHSFEIGGLHKDPDANIRERVKVRELLPNLGESGILALVGMLTPILQMADVGAQQFDLPVLLVPKLFQLDGVFLLLALQSPFKPVAEQPLAQKAPRSQ
jgi:hypothetical protein